MKGLDTGVVWSPWGRRARMLSGSRTEWGQEPSLCHVLHVVIKRN